MKTSERPSKQANIPDSLHHRLHMYALAASAAGVTMLALAPLGEAEIIYKRTHVHIGQRTSYSLDVNGDGIGDFTIGVGQGSSSGAFVIPGQTGNEVVNSAGRNGSYYAAALGAGYVIGSNAKFGPPPPRRKGWYMFRWFFSTPKYGYCWGPWGFPWGAKNGYVGMKFMISGEVHYGWARFGAICGLHHQYVNLVGYAYETIPNQPIVAGQKKGALENESLNNEPAPLTDQVPMPASLGMLAKGGRALPLWKRNQQEAGDVTHHAEGN